MKTGALKLLLASQVRCLRTVSLGDILGQAFILTCSGVLTGIKTIA